MKIFWTLLVLVSLTPIAGAQSPCKEKRKAMHQGRKAMKECNKAWVESLRGDAADPADDCAAKQATFITAIRDLKACIKEAKVKK